MEATMRATCAGEPGVQSQERRERGKVRVLLVEDSRSFASFVAKTIRAELGFETVVAATLAEAKAQLEANPDFLAAVLDLFLPDAPHGECVELALSYHLPSIVLTSDVSDSMRENFWNLHIVDYVLKDNQDNVDYVVQLLARLQKNPGVKTLVVDDSRSYRYAVGRLLSTHRYSVLEAQSGEDALRMLEEHPDTRLVLVDYNMPGMDGFALTREIRRRFGKDMLAVIGVSAEGNARLSARFIKCGANDYLHKPFLAEEFYTRVTQNLEMLDHIAQIRDMAERDFLTRTYNRRYFFSAGVKLHALLARRCQPVTVAMLDIDHFKQVNDNFGHEAGDAVLVHMAQLLKARFRESDIVARMGGEEFCVLASGLSGEQASVLFDDLRRLMEASPVNLCGVEVSYTVSIGLCCRKGMSLDDMLRMADSMLYRSKSLGRNRVSICGAEDSEPPVA